MKRTTILTSGIALFLLALMGLQEIRFRRQFEALRAQVATPSAAAPDSTSELAEAVRQLSQARSELATGQHRLAAALQQVATLQAQAQEVVNRMQAPVGLGPRRLGPRPAIDTTDFFQPQTGQPDGTGRRSWGEEQATGAPDTDRAGDIPTAWASRQPDAGEEWLSLEYANQVQLAEVRVRETHNPGAISKVVAILPNGQEQVIWEGVTDPTEAPVDTVFPVAGNIQAKAVKVYLDTKRVAGWNEIDAVELVGRDGVRQWASHATASSSFADQR